MISPQKIWSNSGLRQVSSGTIRATKNLSFFFNGIMQNWVWQLSQTLAKQVSRLSSSYKDTDPQRRSLLLIPSPVFAKSLLCHSIPPPGLQTSTAHAPPNSKTVDCAAVMGEVTPKYCISGTVLGSVMLMLLLHHCPAPLTCTRRGWDGACTSRGGQLLMLLQGPVKTPTSLDTLWSRHVQDGDISRGCHGGCFCMHAD